MIEKGDIMVNGHKTNGDHEAFKNPLPNYDKGGESMCNNNKGTHINYISTYDNKINVIKIKDK